MDDEWRSVTASRGDDREWEVFCRRDAIRHVGSVSAPSASLAREQAITLFGDATDTIWLCPADECVRLTTRTFAPNDADASAPAGRADSSVTADGSATAPGDDPVATDDDAADEATESEGNEPGVSST